MSDPTILYCVGATKAGTSWLHDALKGHSACALRDIKEAHYWDTVNGADRLDYLETLEGQLHRLRVSRHRANLGNRGWQAANVDRQIAALTEQIDMLCADRQGNAAYLAWLMADRTDQDVVADFSPSYALLDGPALDRMVRVSPRTKIIYLMRDPLSRLWSHVRMAAKRKVGEGEALEGTANNILRRVLTEQSHKQIGLRSDYEGAVTRLTATVPENRLSLMFTEELLAPGGFEQVCAFLGIRQEPADTTKSVHAGTKAKMEPGLREMALAFLKDQYDWAARTFGSLPQAWQNNLERVSA